MRDFTAGLHVDALFGLTDWKIERMAQKEEEKDTSAWKDGHQRMPSKDLGGISHTDAADR